MFKFTCINMVLTRSQIENSTREKLIEELLQISDINYQLQALNDRFDTFTARLEEQCGKH